MRPLLLATALALLPQVSAASPHLAFDVYLDDKPIGHHAFSIQDTGDAVRVKSEAAFQVKLLGIKVFDYAHQAEETWRNGCLTSLKSTTRENRDKTEVLAKPLEQQLLVKVNRVQTEVLPSDCVAAFSYWRPDWLLGARERLLNPQTGEWQTVEVQKELTAHPELGQVKTLKLRGDALEIDVFYHPQNKQWLGLKSKVEGNRTLEYRRNMKEAKNG
jgi:hypothetical protein